MIRRGCRPLGRREFLAGTGGLAALLGGLAFGEFTLAPPAGAATAFGYTSSGGYFTVSTGAGLTFKINQSDGDMTSLNYNGVELQDREFLLAGRVGLRQRREA